MIAGCPKCGARYQVERERLAAGAVRLRCAKCDSVFRVRAPEAEAADANDRTRLHVEPPAPRAAAAPPPAPKPAPVSVARSVAPVASAMPVAAAPASGDLVLIAIPEPDVAKSLADAVAQRGARCIVVHDGVEAALELQRHLPKAAIIAAHLPKMFGFQICELVKRNESLRGTWLVLVGAIHNQDRYRRPPPDTYGADAYIEMPDLPGGVLPLLERGGIRLRAPAAAPAAREVRPPAPVPAPAAPLPRPTSAPAPTRATAVPAPAPAPRAAAAPAPRVVTEPAREAPPRAPVADGLEEQRAKAERLARIIVSDIVLYNEAKFSAAIRQGNVPGALDADLAEGRHLFQERVDARVRAERDYLGDELIRVAKQRGMK